MTRATRLIKCLDKVLAEHDSFGDNPSSFVDTVFDAIEEQLKLVQTKSKPEHWAEIYVERDRAMIKQEVLNRVMTSGSAVVTD